VAVRSGRSTAIDERVGLPIVSVSGERSSAGLRPLQHEMWHVESRPIRMQWDRLASSSPTPTYLSPIAICTASDAKKISVHHLVKVLPVRRGAHEPHA
jgi:hypothetical protein